MKLQKKVNHGNFVTATILEILEMQPEEFSKGDEKISDIPEAMTPAKTYTVTELLEIIHDIEMQQIKYLMLIQNFLRHRKYACLYHKSYEKANTVKTNIDKIFTK